MAPCRGRRRGRLDVEDVEKAEQVTESGLAFVPRLVGHAPAARARRARRVASGGDGRSYRGPLPPVLGKSVQQHHRFALAGALIRVLGGPLAVLVDAGGLWTSATCSSRHVGMATPFARSRYYVHSRSLEGGVRACRHPACSGRRGAVRRGGRARGGPTAGQRAASPGRSRARVVRAPRGASVLVVPWLPELDLTAFQLAAFAVAGLGALLGACGMTSSSPAVRLGSGGAIICSHSPALRSGFRCCGVPPRRRRAGRRPRSWPQASCATAGRWDRATPTR